MTTSGPTSGDRTRSVELPDRTFGAIARRLRGTEFESVDAYVTFALDQLLRELEGSTAHVAGRDADPAPGRAGNGSATTDAPARPTGNGSAGDATIDGAAGNGSGDGDLPDGPAGNGSLDDDAVDDAAGEGSLDEEAIDGATDEEVAKQLEALGYL